ncbi:peroxidase [Catellatospora methionotrophica]|uniref:Peroxidase n=1 Tax=Catellatospora methionotrophica TaxID=121620 RepID=A0A8J3PBT1_9ACTN|nr:Dyp-type peroxidase [Catellatospora methionotrophica]GIG11701.1 peroxidase [Catellatospora methionotrophica]
MSDDNTRWGRRRLLTGGGLAAGAALTGAGLLAGRQEQPPAAASVSEAAVGEATAAFHGPHQAGVATPPQAHAVFLALDLRRGTDRQGLARMMRLLCDDAARLTQGRAALADTEPELAGRPARLTVTFGFGPDLFAKLDLGGSPVRQLPKFGIDRLQTRWCGGDVLVQICSDDPVTVTHSQRMLVKDARAFTTVRWLQRGFRRAAGADPAAMTQRNLLGQVDGTIQPADDVHDRALWVSDGPGWLHGGTTVVVRRIRAELETWDAVDRGGKELTIGRRLDTGAPLTGGGEHDPADYAAVDGLGLPVISQFAHIRRAHVADPARRILRRPYNYDDGLTADGTPDTGLVFAAYQADIARQYLPVQQALAESDLLNEWTTPIGSAVFAIPPGCRPGGYVGQQLLDRT